MKELKQLEIIAKQRADNFEPCTFADTKDILAIAEAFRALEKRAEAAEAENSYMGGGARYWHDEYCAQQQRLVAKIVDLEAKLAEMEKQEPVAWCPKTQIELLAKHRMVEADLSSMQRFDEVPLFTRPAPAISLAELVPDAVGIHDMDPDSKDIEVVTAIAQCEGWNACLAAILRNNEEANK